MSYDASAQALRCPFCGSTKLHQRPDARTLKAEKVIPLRVDRAAVETSLRTWLAQGFWRPGDTAAASTIASATCVFVPFWIFSARTETNWTGDQSPPPVYSRADWYAISGQHAGTHNDVAIAASSVLATGEVDAILPFDSRTAIGPDAIDLTNEVVEDFRLPRSDARLIARGKIEAEDAVQCQQYFRGRCRNIHVNVVISDMADQTMLAPIWIMVYHYRDKPFRVLINGQTGKLNGNAPVSLLKVSFAIVAIIVVVALAVLLLVVANSR